MSIWNVRFLIKSFVIFEEKFILNNFKFFSIEDKSYATSSVEADSMGEAEKYVVNSLSNILKTFKFTLSEKFSFSLIDIQQEIAEEIHLGGGASIIECCAIVSKIFPADKLTEVNELLEMVSNTNHTGIIAYQAYLRGLEIYEWNIEAFLNFFKAIETISNQYIDSGKQEKKSETLDDLNKLIKKLEKQFKEQVIDKDKVENIAKEIYKLGFVELKKKICLAIKDLGISVINGQVDRLVRLRNTIAAHGSSNQNISDQELSECESLARCIVLKYIEKMYLE